MLTVEAILYLSNLLITNWRSIAERGGCFQRRLFACQHDNFRTINVGL